MASSSGTYDFNPSIAQITFQAFHMCGVRPTALLQEHMESARMAANFVLADWGNKGVNLWKVEAFTTPFVEGQSVYPVSPKLVEILDLYMTLGGAPSGGSAPGLINRYLLPISRTEFAGYPNPFQQSTPTVYWHNRTLTPDLNFYPTPNSSNDTFTYYAVTQMQDAGLANGQVADIPYLWLNAFAKALAAELALIWAPDKVPLFTALADKAWMAAAVTNTEISNVYISPQLSGYWR